MNTPFRILLVRYYFVPPLQNHFEIFALYVGLQPGMLVLIRLNQFFHLRKNRNQSNRIFAIFCDFWRFFAIFCDFLLGNQIKHPETTGEDLLDLLPSMVSLLGTVESSK